MRNERGRYEIVAPGEGERDPNGRIVARVHFGAGPSWDEIWRAHVRRNWDRRHIDGEEDNRAPRRQAYLRRRGF